MIQHQDTEKFANFSHLISTLLQIYPKSQKTNFLKFMNAIVHPKASTNILLKIIQKLEQVAADDEHCSIDAIINIFVRIYQISDIILQQKCLIAIRKIDRKKSKNNPIYYEKFVQQKTSDFMLSSKTKTVLYEQNENNFNKNEINDKKIIQEIDNLLERIDKDSNKLLAFNKNTPNIFERNHLSKLNDIKNVLNRIK